VVLWASLSLSHHVEAGDWQEAGTGQDEGSRLKESACIVPGQLEVNEDNLPGFIHRLGDNVAPSFRPSASCMQRHQGKAAAFAEVEIVCAFAHGLLCEEVTQLFFPAFHSILLSAR